MKKSKDGGIRIGLTALLTCLFVALKLLGKITWSWLWVLSPIIIKFIFILFVFFIGMIVLIINERL